MNVEGFGDATTEAYTRSPSNVRKNKFKTGGVMTIVELKITASTHPQECPFLTNKIDYQIGVSEEFDVLSHNE